MLGGNVDAEVLQLRGTVNLRKDVDGTVNVKGVEVSVDGEEHVKGVGGGRGRGRGLAGRTLHCTGS